ncbi:glycosyltransferase [Microbacterium radiodurans]|uniref:Glycosyltransferase n=1 Tax=Microbacterium radiodurans TaxID=661398 RepID=A0A5J5IUB5_9MICO|nr:glycosyltransferase [Microbacterium radiodurans]KAA9089704.1 glycosyltransferase [Microbacterium radiodurans]
MRRLRIAVIAPLRFPIARPHAGGLEAAVWSEVEALRARGHRVDVVAVRGSEHVVPGSVFEMPELGWAADAVRTDKTYPPAYELVSVPMLRRALEAIAADADAYDVVSNHCLHPLPLRMAPSLGVPMVTTLHTPVDAGFVSAHRSAGRRGSVFLSVSEHTRRQWLRAGVASTLLPNGVDPDVWRPGAGGDGLVWFGRVVPEKAPHLAIEVARALGRPLTIAGRIGDRQYADEMIAPRLGGGIGYVGELRPEELASLVGSSALALATPAWAEPFGLVGPEALMTGTPVVGFAVGGVPEIAAASIGMQLVEAGDVDAMAAVAREMLAVSDDPRLRAPLRRRIRARAVERFSIEARITALERLYGEFDRDAVPVEMPA